MWVCFSSYEFAEIKRNNANKLPLKKKKKKVLSLTRNTIAPTGILCIGKVGPPFSGFFQVPCPSKLLLLLDLVVQSLKARTHPTEHSQMRVLEWSAEMGRGVQRLACNFDDYNHFF